MKKKLDLESYNLIKKKIDEMLLDPSQDLSNPANRQTLFEQYKLLVDSSQKVEERRKDSNNIFIAINSIFLTFLTQVTHFTELNFEKFLVLCLLLFIGVIICWDWFKLINSYKQFNYINYSLIYTFERILPARLFSLRTDILSELDEPDEKANAILTKETIIPKLFLMTYITLFFIVLIFSWLKSGGGLT